MVFLRQNYSYIVEKRKRDDDRFYESSKELRIHKQKIMDASTQKRDNPFDGPNGITARASRGQIARSKRIPVTLPKMSWDK